MQRLIFGWIWKKKKTDDLLRRYDLNSVRFFFGHYFGRETNFTIKFTEEEKRIEETILFGVLFERRRHGTLINRTTKCTFPTVVFVCLCSLCVHDIARRLFWFNIVTPYILSPACCRFNIAPCCLSFCLSHIWSTRSYIFEIVQHLFDSSDGSYLQNYAIQYAHTHTLTPIQHVPIPNIVFLFPYVSLCFTRFLVHIYTLHRYTWEMACICIVMCW